MKFPLKCRTKTLGIIYSILGNLFSFLNWEGADSAQIRPRKIPVFVSRYVWRAVLRRLFVVGCVHLVQYQ